uniref:F-box domain-containing protein n=1 Tax=Heterorhabditis bacteriophora TaxID=37862 RepID=A0A1I7XQ45_HETBA
MAAIFDMTRRVTLHDTEGELKTKLNLLEIIEEKEEERQPPRKPNILQSGQVCKRWRTVACSPLLWKFVSFRPSYGGIQVHMDYLYVYYDYLFRGFMLCID